ncbi:MAG: response regulator [bacterium]|nr:response regulator [bacterium]
MASASILMVDDSPVNLVVLRALLGKEGYELIAADSGQAAIDLLRSNPGFDLVLLDVSMPDLNGIAVCRTLKSDPKTAHIPVVLLSAVRTDDDSITAGREAGADGYLTKPVADKDVRAWVKSALRISRAFRECEAEQSASTDHAEDCAARFHELSCRMKVPLEALYAEAEILANELEGQNGPSDRVESIKANAERIARLVAEARGAHQGG